MVGDEELARRLESFQATVSAEMADALNEVDPGVHADVLHVGDGNALFAGVGSPLTQAINVHSDVEGIEEFFFERGADSVIQVTPWTPQPFTNELAKRGYGVFEFENVFAIEVRVAPPTSAAIEIEQSRNVLLWSRIAAEAFANEEMSVDFLIRVMTPFAHVKHARTYIAYVDGQPAGSAAMFAVPEINVAGFFGAGTRERFRNRGVQSALLQRRISDAAKLGCEIGMVTTQPGSASHRNVARRGFELMYTKLSMRLDRSSRDA